MPPMPRILLFLALFGMFLGSVPANSFAATAQIKLGIDVLADRNFDLLQGKRVGMLTHSAAVNSRGMSDAEVLAKAPGVNVVALFAPEHGFDGELKAEENVNDTTPTPQPDCPCARFMAKPESRPQRCFRISI
jgi:uncharacterized protein YbbC (DUF1343 family)